MVGAIANQLLMKRHRQLTKTLHTEPKHEEILSSFLHTEVTTEVSLIPTIPKKKKITFKMVIITKIKNTSEVSQHQLL